MLHDYGDKKILNGKVYVFSESKRSLFGGDCGGCAALTALGLSKDEKLCHRLGTCSGGVWIETKEDPATVAVPQSIYVTVKGVKGTYLFDPRETAHCQDCDAFAGGGIVSSLSDGRHVFWSKIAFGGAKWDTLSSSYIKDATNIVWLANDSSILIFIFTTDSKVVVRTKFLNNRLHDTSWNTESRTKYSSEKLWLVDGQFIKMKKRQAWKKCGYE